MIAGTSNCSSPEFNDDDRPFLRVPKVQAAQTNNLKITVTPKTASVPRGKIITDNGRGTTFWEVAESSDEDIVADVEPMEKHWSRPFQVEWISR